MWDHYVYMVMIYAIFAAGIFLWNRLMFALQPLVVLMALTCIIETAGLILFRQGANNHWLYHLLNPIATVLLLEIFRRNTSLKWEGMRQNLRLAGLASVVVSAGLAWSVEPLTVSPSYSSMFSALLIVLGCLWFFFSAVQEPAQFNIWQLPVFWVAFGALLFYSGTFFVFGLLNVMLETATGVEFQIFLIVRVLNFVMYPSFLVALLLGKQND